MSTFTATTITPANSSYASTSYHPSSYIQQIHASDLPSHTTSSPIILPPVPALSNPVLTTPSTNGGGKSQSTAPSYHPYTKPSIHLPHSAQPSSPLRLPSTFPSSLPNKHTLDNTGAESSSEHVEPDPAQALNDLHYLSSLTIAQRTELYRRSRLHPLSPSSSEQQGWLSYLPSLLHTFKSRCSPSIPTSTSSRAASLPTLPSSSHLLEAYTALSHLLASERLENAKLKKVCEVLKRQVREVSARCCALEALGFGGALRLEGLGAVEGLGGKGKGKGKRGVKRRLEEDVEEGKRTSPSPMSTTTAASRFSTPAGGKKRVSASSPSLSTSSRTLTNTSASAKLPAPMKLAGAPRKLSPAIGTTSTLTPISLSSSATSRTSTPSSLSLGLSLKPLKYDDESVSDADSLPTPSYLPIPFLSQQARSVNAVPEVKSLRDIPLENMDTMRVNTVPDATEKSTTLECLPKRINSANGVRTKAIRAKGGVTKREPTAMSFAVECLSPGLPFENTPSPPAATAVEGGDEEREQENATRERDLLRLMFIKLGREIECRACRINTTYPRSHAKHLPASLVHTFIPDTTESELIAHLVSHHAAEWEEMKRLSDREVGMLKARLGVKDEYEAGRVRDEEKGKEKKRTGYRDLATGEFVPVDVGEERVRERVAVDEVPEVRMRRVPATESIVMMKLAAVKAQREGMGKGMVCVGV